jgi:cytochrome c-type biogenesis protein CcmF
VHSFAYSDIGPYFLGFLALALIVSIGLFVYRLPRLRPEHEFDSVVSREGSFLANNLLLTGIAFATFWGTIFPIISSVVRGQTMTVGTAFYQQVDGPLFLALIFVMGVGPLLAWRRASRESLVRNFRWPALVAAVVAVALPILGMHSLWAVAGFAICAFSAATIFFEVWRGTSVRHRHGESYPKAMGMLLTRHRQRYGGYLVHLGLILLAVGVIGSQFFQAQRDGLVERGKSLTINGYFTVSRDGSVIEDIYPGERIFPGFEDQPTSIVSITDHGLTDLYVFLAGFDGTSSATIRVFINPLVPLVWLGGLLMLLGGIFCWWPLRRASPVRLSEAKRPEKNVEVAV